MQKIITTYFVISIFHAVTYAQLPDSLNKYYTPISLQNPEIAWNKLSPTLKGKKMFLFGEAHGVAMNNILQLSLLKYLHKRAHIRYLLIEASPSEGFLYDNYLQTGNDYYLRNNSYAFIEDDRIFWKGVYRYNASLPDSSKIRVFGVENYKIEPFVQAMVLMFIDATRGKGIPTRVLGVYNQVSKNLNTYKGHRKLFDLVKKGIKTHPEVYKKYLGKNFWYCQYIVTNPLHRENSGQRDKRMALNITKLLKWFKQGRFFGIFGVDHTTKYRKQKNMRYYLANGQNKASILGVDAHYTNSKAIFNGEEYEYQYISAFKTKHFDCLDFFKKASRTNLTLISPHQALLKRYKFVPNGDFIIYLKNQKAYTYKRKSFED